jgi:hypothetical protein
MVQVERVGLTQLHNDAGFHPPFAAVLGHDGPEVSVRGDEQHENCTQRNI